MTIASILLIFAVYLILSTEPHSTIDPEAYDYSADCGLNVSCFLNAISKGCIKTEFVVPSFDNTGYFDGRIIGKRGNKCEIVLKDEASNLSATCFISEKDLLQIGNVDKIGKVCSGDLLP